MSFRIVNDLPEEGEGEGEGEGLRGLKGKQRGNQSSRTKFNGGPWKIDFQWKGGGGGGKKERGKGDHWNTPEPHGRDLVNFILSPYHFKVLKKKVIEQLEIGQSREGVFNTWSA